MIDEFPDETDASRRLQRIADTLGCSPDDFLGGTGRLQSMNDTAQLLRFWFAIRTATDREKVVELARRLAAD